MKKMLNQAMRKTIIYQILTEVLQIAVYIRLNMCIFLLTHSLERAFNEKLYTHSKWKRTILAHTYNTFSISRKKNNKNGFFCKANMNVEKLKTSVTYLKNFLVKSSRATEMVPRHAFILYPSYRFQAFIS